MEIIVMLFAIIMFVIMVGGAIFTLIYGLVKESKKEDVVETDGHKCRIKATIRDGSITEVFRKPLPDEKVTFIPDEFTVVEMDAVSAVIMDSNGNKHAVPTKLLMLVKED